MAAGALGSLDTALNVAFPDLLDGFGIEVPALQWVVVTYVLAYGAALLAAGQVGDAVDHRLLVQLGAVVSAAAMAGCALAPGFGWFLMARVVQGLGAAMVMAGGPALATGAVEGAARGRALGAFTASTGFGAALGPTVGGPLVALAGWPAVFWFRVPLALAVVGLAIGLRGRPSTASGPGDRPTEAAPGDGLGAGLVALALTGGLLVVGSSQTLGPTSPVVLAAAAMTIAVMALYRHRAARHPHPVLPPGLLGRPPVALAAALAVVANGSMFVAWLLVPTLAVDHLGASTTAAGLALAASPLAMGASAPLAGRWLDRSGPRRPVIAGLVAEAAGLTLLATAPPEAGLGPVALAMAVIGVGLGIFGVANLAEIMAALPTTRAGVGGGLALLLRTVGIVAGVAGSAALFARLEPGRTFIEAYRGTTAVSAGLALTGAAAAVMIRPRPSGPGPGETGSI